MFECLCVDTQDGLPRVNKTERRIARKPHRCCECGEEINPGDQYEYVRGIWGDGWFTFKTCRACAEIRQDFMSCGWTYGQLWTHLRCVYDGEEWVG